MQSRTSPDLPPRDASLSFVPAIFVLRCSGDTGWERCGRGWGAFGKIVFDTGAGHVEEGRFCVGRGGVMWLEIK